MINTENVSMVSDGLQAEPDKRQIIFTTSIGVSIIPKSKMMRNFTMKRIKQNVYAVQVPVIILKLFNRKGYKMVTINIKKLIEVISEADTFGLPDMTAGAQYLYNNIYQRLLRDEEIKLSEIDFKAFKSDDLTLLENLHTDVFEKNERTADSIAFVLRKITPVYNAVSFV